MKIGGLLLCLLGVLSAAPDESNAAPPAKSFAGPWRLSRGQQSCDIKLDAAPAGHGFALIQHCGDAFGVQSVAGWRPYDGGIVFLSDTGAPVVTFEEAEDGLYLDSNDPALALRPAVKGEVRPSQAKVTMAGTWTLGPASGAGFCSLVFGANGVLAAADPCRPEWRARHFAAWKLADHQLTLLDARGQAIRHYRQRDPNTFEDTLDLETPLLLWRPVR